MKVLIHSSNVPLSERARRFIQEKVSFRLKRFDNSVDKVDLYLKDVNGPKGGLDKECTLSIKPSDSKAIVVSSKANSIFLVVRQCAVKAKLALSKRLKMKKSQRRKPILLGYEGGAVN